MSKPRIAITFREGSENGGPFVSHLRIMNSGLRNEFDFVPLNVPVPRVLRTRDGMDAFVRSIESLNPDLVQFAGLQLEGFLVSQALLRVKHTRSLLAIHGSCSEAQCLPKWKKLILSVLERKTVSNSDYCYAVSHYVEGWKVTQSSNNCLGVVYNLSGNLDTVCDREDMRKKLGIPLDAPVVVSTGRIIEEKGYDLVVPIFERLCKRHNAHLILVGDGWYLNKLREEVGRADLGNQVIFTGYKQSVNDYLNASDIYWTSTKHETLGCSIIEACSFGLPVVATNVGGIPEIVEDGVCGYLIDNNDVSGFADKLSLLCSDVQLRRRMGLKAKQRIDSVYSEQAITSQLAKIYSKVLSCQKN